LRDHSNNKIPKRDFITALAKGLEILQAFNQNNPEMSVADLADELNISRASSRRFLLTLENLGFLQKQGQKYQLTSKVMSLGASYYSSKPLAEIAQPYLDRVTQESGESCSLAVLESGSVVFIARAQSRWIMNIGLTVGSRLPVHNNALGRVLLAHKSLDYQQQHLSEAQLIKHNSRTITDLDKLQAILVKTRKQGYAIVDQELEEGLRAIAVPIEKDGNVVASISISSLANRANLKHLREVFLPLLNETAANISKDISHSEAY